MTTIEQQGYQLLSSIYSNQEIDDLREAIDELDPQHPNVRKGKNLFAVRHLLEVSPSLTELIFNDALKNVLAPFGQSLYLIKSLYFDKPPQSNWFVFYHQDLTISVQEKRTTSGYVNWTHKHGVSGVQPPVTILKNILTCRIHLDDCDQENGGLRVLPHSHRQGILSSQAIESIKLNTPSPIWCNAAAGDVLFMKPLLLHASPKNSSNRHRRVIHLEFATEPLNTNLKYREWVLCRLS